MTYAQKSWAEERASWKAVVLLNLVRSINTVVDILTVTMDGVDLLEASDSATPKPSSSQLTPLNETHRKILKRLGALRQIERDLKTLLGSGAEEVEPEGGDTEHQFLPKIEEFSVRSSSGWKDVLSRVRNPTPGKDVDIQRVALQVITSCQDDILRLWTDPGTRSVLRSRETHIEDSPGL